MTAAKAHLPVLERYHHGALRGAARHRRGRDRRARGDRRREPLHGSARSRSGSRDLAPRADATTIRDDDAGGGASQGAEALGGEGCSVIWAESPTGRILAQTWDMHATAIPYVMVLGVPESDDGPAARLLTVTGCLGMAGMNTARVAIAINNLYSTDATLGIVWPAMVRRALHEDTAAAARDVIVEEPDRLGASLLRRRSQRGVRDRVVGHAAPHDVRRREADVLPHEPLPRRRRRRAQQGAADEHDATTACSGSRRTSRAHRSAISTTRGSASAARKAGRAASARTWRRPRHRTAPRPAARSR